MMGSSQEADVRQKFQNCLKTYRKVNINESLDKILKRRLPKICFDDTTKPIIRQVNEILSEEIDDELSIEELHTLTYCGAKTVVELCQEKNLPVYDQSKLPKKFPKEENEQKQLFKISPSTFRRLLFDQSIEIDQNERPPEAEVQKFWSKSWQVEDTNWGEFEKNRRKYLENEEKRINQNASDEVMDKLDLKIADFKKALKKKNWSPPGIDGVQFFWYKKLKPLRRVWLKKINAIVKGKEKMPDFFTVGFTELLPKDGDTEDPSNYRPITHLPVIYKIITRCIYQKIFTHYEKFKILADEQCGGRKGCYGIRKALVIDSVALDQETVFGYYIDFKKAFDSVRHDWILELLKVYKVDDSVVRFLEGVMKSWKSRICLPPDFITGTINLEKGVFQGDPIAVILFWTAINPLSFELRDSENSLQLKKGGSISHLLYMDDLKLYSSNEDALKKMYTIVDDFSKAINLSINVKKTKEFRVPMPPQKPVDKLYLGYIQTPKINNDETIYHRVRKFEDKYKTIKRTLISEDDKKWFRTKFLFTSVFNTFGVLHWRVFKRVLVEVDLKGKIVDLLQKYKNDVPVIYLKLLNDLCKMRRQFFKEMDKSELMKTIVENDTVTPLMLSQRNETDFLESRVATVRERTRKRKASE